MFILVAAFTCIYYSFFLAVHNPSLWPTTTHWEPLFLCAKWNLLFIAQYRWTKTYAILSIYSKQASAWEQKRDSNTVSLCFSAVTFLFLIIWYPPALWNIFPVWLSQIYLPQCQRDLTGMPKWWLSCSDMSYSRRQIWCFIKRTVKHHCVYLSSHFCVCLTSYGEMGTLT